MESGVYESELDVLHSAVHGPPHGRAASIHGPNDASGAPLTLGAAHEDGRKPLHAQYHRALEHQEALQLRRQAPKLLDH
eukprot:1339354-Amorphochlora_amoeboformis.AAC.1